MESDDCYGDYLSLDSRDILLWWICSTVREANILSEWKIGPDNSVYIITLFLCRLLSDVCYEDHMTVDEDYCGGRYSFRTHRCEWKIGPDKSVYIITLFLYRLLLDGCYEDCMTVDEDYCGEYVSLFATIRCWSSTCVLLDVVVNHWIVVMYYYE
jgi:hypothetical protein